MAGETLAQTISRLRERGVLEMTNQHVVLRDIDAIRKMAEA